MQDLLLLLSRAIHGIIPGTRLRKANGDGEGTFPLEKNLL